VTYQIVIENLRHGVAHEINRRVLRRVLVYLGTVHAAAERRRLVVHVGEDNRHLGADGRLRFDLRQLSHGNFQNESAIAVLLGLPVQLRSREHKAGSRVDIEQVFRTLRDAVHHFVVYPLVAIHGTNCNETSPDYQSRRISDAPASQLINFIPEILDR